MTRAMISMFELTVGNWVPILRFLHDRVNEWFGLALLVYRCFVGFAVMKVITGVFLHETFKVAASDDDLMIRQKQRDSAKHLKKMRLLFREADDSGDGFLTFREFKEVMEDPRVKAWLAAMDLDVGDVELVFGLLDGGVGLRVKVTIASVPRSLWVVSSG
eukprot:CAMPEP_0180804022 /NCGR_PEP_ID=MMETSP1038_2-20121128/61233_1 /TAXON_ID=632150 /ORGANISM="Azadinium spinosum, Strain 3D9" /LENGTH=159 /DNA_ID=CAMNT_0022844425 /DNA_START=148 /DNA_END=627 /DNA_ORIENTATION=-